MFPEYNYYNPFYYDPQSYTILEYNNQKFALLRLSYVNTSEVF